MMQVYPHGSPPPSVHKSESIEALRTKHRLMYLDIKLLCFVQDCLQQKLNSENQDEVRNDPDDDFNQIVDCYRTFDRSLNGQVDQKNIPHFLKIIEEQLGKLSQKRLLLTKSLETYLSSLSKSQLVEMQQDVIHHYDEIIALFRKSGTAPQEKVSLWEEKLKQFLINLSFEVEEKTLQKYCGLLFSSVARKAEIWTLYLSWAKTLQEQGVHLPQQNSLRTALKIKNFLYTFKDVYFSQFFNKREHRVRALRKCLEWKNEEKTPQAMIEILSHETQLVKVKITAAEEKLLLSIGSFSNYASAFVRVFSSCTQVRMANFLVESQDRVLKNNPDRFGALLATPLTGPYLNLSKALAVGGLFACEIAQWKLFGLTQSLLSSMVHQIAPSADNWIAFCQRIKLDDKKALQSLPYLISLFEMCVFAGINGYSVGYRAKTISLICVGYIIASSASHGSGKAVDVIYRRLYRGHPLKNIPSHLFVRSLTQWVTFPVVHGRIFPFVLNQVQLLTTRPDVLSDEGICLTNKELCRRETTQILGLPKNANLKVARKAFHQFSLENHPDKKASATDLYLIVKNAYDLFLKLERKNH